MKNINLIKRSISVILVALILASAALLTGCKDDHDGHDHGANTINPNIAVLVPASKLEFAGVYPTVSSYNVNEVKTDAIDSTVSYFRVAKKEGNQLYCTSGNTTMVNYIIVDCPIDAKIGEYILCNTKSYRLSAERFGLTDSHTFYEFYVVFGEEMENATIISKDNVANIFAGPLHGEYNPLETEDPHAGHDHG